MTRDEAIKIWKATFTGHEASWGERELQDTVEADVDAFVKLGMLKLDEPKSDPVQRLMERMGTPTHPSHIPGMLRELGLQITEK